MTNPNLSRCVWLTEEQRKVLKTVADSSYLENPSLDISQLIAELQDLSMRNAHPTPSNIQIIIKGLRLPPDILPVSLCDALADELIESGRLSSELVYLIKPLPRKDV